ncbi:MAG TPA: hypothetical protein DCG19_03290 [Cryomorphaceae bacterium]|nr:hypothetical protein [Owenweeksia sp.]MBF97554.1 hypothetical protein [Owenweeksia sp.]HAD96402.1 hypothetical protein [Cryomorphaceae bacterium]|tara:strand:- start:89 stop:775 length:687 start_codon:yes stop_codon:yes gene_type:complete
MTIQEVHQSILQQLNNVQWGHVSHELIDQALDEAQMTRFTNLYSDPQEYPSGPNPTPRIAFGKTQKIEDELSPFIQEINFDKTQTSSGILQYPSDYQHFLSILVKNSSRIVRVKVMSENDLPMALSSQITTPTVARPVAIYNGKGRLQFFPEVPFEGRSYYLRRPTKPLFAYTLNNRTVTYDPANSTDLEWLDSSQTVIIQEAIKWLSNHLRDQWSHQSSSHKLQIDG